tara:strand:- start:1004 stop:1210 length:207 start_codon:yes stop_codon:yes gene_type:complete
MDVDDIHILAASVVLLYEDHLMDSGHIKSAVELARGMRMLRNSLPEDVLDMCLEFKSRPETKKSKRPA